MFVINSEKLPQHFLEIITEEQVKVKEFTEKVKTVKERLESAQNLKDNEGLVNASNELQALRIGMNSFMSRKVIIMSMMINKNKNFKDN